VLGVPDGRGGHGLAGAVERGAQQRVFSAEVGEFIAGGVWEVALPGELPQVFHDVHDVHPR
jgi:hypothetical protein